MLSFLILFTWFCCFPAAQINSIWAPHPVGEPVATTILFGDEYVTPIEVYDARISVTEVVRGEKAWHILRKESASNDKPEPGFEYILARIRFEFAARGKPGDKNYILKEDQFTAFSADGLIQYRPANAVWPHSRLDRTLRAGESTEGWVTFIVSRNEPKPIMVFRADVLVLSHSGTGPAFRLY